jgi:hypothetical protein
MMVPMKMLMNCAATRMPMGIAGSGAPTASVCSRRAASNPEKFSKSAG